MSRTYLDQSVSKALFLEILNHPERPLGYLYRTHQVAVNKVYDEYRRMFGTTPHLFRKRYHQPSLDVVDYYGLRSRVEFSSTSPTRMLFNETSANALHSDDDVPVRLTVEQLQITMRGREFSFQSSRSIYNKGTVWLYSPGGEASVKVSFKERCKISSVTAELVRGPGSDEVVDFPYSILIDFDVDTLAYACKGRKHHLKTLKNHPDENLTPSEFADFTPNGNRHVYVLEHGKTLIVTGFDSELIEEEVLALGQGWKRKELTNRYRQFLRSKFALDRLSILDPRDAIRYTTRIESAIDSISGVTTYVVAFNGHNYRVLIDSLDDLGKFYRLDPYIVSGPTRLLKEKIVKLATTKNETIIEFGVIVNEIETHREVNGLNVEPIRY